MANERTWWNMNAVSAQNSVEDETLSDGRLVAGRRVRQIYFSPPVDCECVSITIMPARWRQEKEKERVSSFVLCTVGHAAHIAVRELTCRLTGGWTLTAAQPADSQCSNSSSNNTNGTFRMSFVGSFGSQSKPSSGCSCSFGVCVEWTSNWSRGLPTAEAWPPLL